MIPCMGIVKYLNEKGIRIPENISVACFNDSIYNLFSKPTVTTVTVDCYQLGMRAAETLLAVLENKRIEKGY